MISVLVVTPSLRWVNQHWLRSSPESETATIWPVPIRSWSQIGVPVVVLFWIGEIEASLCSSGQIHGSIQETASSAAAARTNAGTSS